MSVQIVTTTPTRRSPVEVESNQGLRCDSLLLRPLGYADEPAFLEALERSREPLRRWIPLEGKNESASDYFHQQVQKAIEGDSSNTACRRAIFLNDNTFVGMVNIIKIERGMEWTAEANWWIDSKHAGKGLGTKAVQALLDHAFADMPIGLGLHQVRAMICLDNPASVRIAERLGFKNSGHTDLLEINEALVMHHEFTRWSF
ncbi:MAG: GNAT family N-acetyltransferase [Phycisphaerales bacterium]|nr:GNAT family N-acetyltransferase [Phycisphaerales bacterium]